MCARKRALNCWPRVRSLTHPPEAVIHSPAAMVAACPTTVTTSRCPRTLARSTQTPLSELWYVTRSTTPDRTFWCDVWGCGLMTVHFSVYLMAKSPEHYRFLLDA